MYLPSIGFSLLIAYLFHFFFQKEPSYLRKYSSKVLPLFFIALFALSFSQSRLWHKSSLVIKSSYNIEEMSYPALISLGHSFMEEDDPRSAMPYFNRAKFIDFRLSDSYIGLIHAYIALRDFDAAEKVYIEYSKLPIVPSEGTELAGIQIFFTRGDIFRANFMIEKLKSKIKTYPISEAVLFLDKKIKNKLQEKYVNSLYFLGMDSFRKKEIKNSIKYLTMALKFLPQDAPQLPIIISTLEIMKKN
jgi:tetratricopeptide (TPR) repeat protein